MYRNFFIPRHHLTSLVDLPPPTPIGLIEVVRNISFSSAFISSQHAISTNMNMCMNPKSKSTSTALVNETGASLPTLLRVAVKTFNPPHRETIGINNFGERDTQSSVLEVKRELEVMRYAYAYACACVCRHFFLCQYSGELCV